MPLNSYIMTRRVWSWYLTLTLLLLGQPGSGATADESYLETGGASYYHDRFHGRLTASGEPYDRNAYTAAHRSLPFGTWLKVTRVDSDRTVYVRVTDRGPFKEGRVVDLSREAAEELELIGPGVAEVEIAVVEDPEVTLPYLGSEPAPLPTPIPSLMPHL